MIWTGFEPLELPELSSMQLDPEHERVRAWAAAQIPEPGGPEVYA